MDHANRYVWLSSLTGAQIRQLKSPSGYRTRMNDDKKIRDKKITSPAIRHSIAARSEELGQKNLGQKNEKELNREWYEWSAFAFVGFVRFVVACFVPLRLCAFA
jgi:hypothetical protein